MSIKNGLPTCYPYVTPMVLTFEAWYSLFLVWAPYILSASKSPVMQLRTRAMLGVAEKNGLSTSYPRLTPMVLNPYAYL